MGCEALKWGSSARQCVFGGGGQGRLQGEQRVRRSTIATKCELRGSFVQQPPTHRQQHGTKDGHRAQARLGYPHRDHSTAEVNRLDEAVVTARRARTGGGGRGRMKAEEGSEARGGRHQTQGLEERDAVETQTPRTPGHNDAWGGRASQEAPMPLPIRVLLVDPQEAHEQ